jgi:hypothetical protein
LLCSASDSEKVERAWLVFLLAAECGDALEALADGKVPALALLRGGELGGEVCV